MHQYLIELASLMAIFSFAIISPGADLAMVMRQAMVHGRKQAIITSFGVGTSLMFHVTYTILGLGLIISQSIYLFNIVKWLGVAYLIYIGVKALRAGKTELPAAEGEGVQAKSSQTALKAFTLGFAANALNPKPVFLPVDLFDSGSCSHAGRHQIRIRSRHGKLPYPVVRRCQPVHDDTTHAGHISARQPMDRPHQRRGLHRTRYKTRNGKSGLSFRSNASRAMIRHLARHQSGKRTWHMM
jgi:hypothetical protein